MASSPTAVRAALVLLSAALFSCTGQAPRDDYFDDFDFAEDVPLAPVPYVDLDRYMGRWYLIANIPYFAEAGNLAPYVEYSRRADGMIDDFYTARDAFDQPPFTKHGLIEVTDPIRNAEGRITFLRPLWQDYAVVYLDEDYRHTVIGHPSRNYCWIFAREPEVDEATYQKMLDALVYNGFNVSRVLKFPQRPDQVGQPGFQ